MSFELPHLTPSGEVHMVDVSAKDVTVRNAVAEAVVTMSDETAKRLFGEDLPKGDALATVRLAGIMGAKRTAELVPLCHPLPLDAVEVEVEQDSAGARIRASVTTTGRTGVEMEAMTAVSVAALTLYDMVKGLERGVQIGPIRLLRKSGGRSGTWEANS
jgi:cyclic pyranopterin phosphate synthase